MTDKVCQAQTQFHKMPKHQRLNNPTFASHSVGDSLTLFTPQKQEQQQGTNKQSEYKRNFEGMDKLNTLGVYQQPTNYARYSKDAFEVRTKSTFSQHGACIMSNNSEWFRQQ